MKKKIALVLGFVVSIASFYLVFRNVDFRQLKSAFLSFNLVWLIPCLFFFYFSMYLRAVRWALFFRPHHVLSARRLFRPMMIGFAFNNVLPSGRIGEVVRAFIVGKREKTGLPTALATIVTERIFDGVTLLIALAISLALMPPIDPAMTVSFWGFEVRGADIGPFVRSIVVGCIVLVVGVLIFLIPAVPRLAVRIIYGLPLLDADYKKPLAGFVEGVARGFESVRDVRVLAGIVGYSLAIWALIALSTLTLSYGFPEIEMNYIHALALMALIAVFIVIPAAPGYWGLFEAGAIFSLIVMDIQHDQSISAAYAIVLHLTQYLPIVAVGLLFAAQDQVRVTKIKTDEETTEALAPEGS